MWPQYKIVDNILDSKHFDLIKNINFETKENEWEIYKHQIFLDDTVKIAYKSRSDNTQQSDVFPLSYETILEIYRVYNPIMLNYLKELAKIERQHILLIDDFGIQPLDAQSRSTLMEIIEDRHGKSSTIITSQVPVSMWHEIIGEQTIADAILDRIVHDSYRVEMKGDSLRKKRQPKTEEEIALENFKN